jgi:hypothetical protein
MTTNKRARCPCCGQPIRKKRKQPSPEEVARLTAISKQPRNRDAEKADFVVRIIKDWGPGFVASKVAKEAKVSPSYVHKIMGVMRRAGEITYDKSLKHWTLSSPDAAPSKAK